VRYFQSDQGFGMTKSDTLHNPTDSIPNDIDMFGRKIMAGPSISLNLSEQLNLQFSGYVRRLVGEFYNEALSNVATRTDTEMVSGVPVVQTTHIRDSTRYEESYWKSVSHDGQVEAQTRLNLGEHNSVVAGVEYLANRIRFGHTVSRETGEPLWGSTRRNETIHNGAIYAQDELRVLDRLNLLPGIRADYHSLFGVVVSPKLGASLRITEWLTTRASGGRAFRAPTLSELYLPALEMQPGITLLANPDLKPEYLLAGDLGIDISLRDMLYPRVSGFYNRMDDLIIPSISSTITEYIDKEEVRITHRNVDKAWSAGIEAELEFRYRRWLRVKLSYALTESEDRETGKPLDYIPRHKGSALLRAGVPIGPLRGSGWVAVDIVGPRGYLDWQAPAKCWDVDVNWNNLEDARPHRLPLDSYTKIDLSLKLAYRGAVWAGIGVQNLTDVKYKESGGILAPGRMVWLRLGGGFPAR
jgi:outer membrane receptor for ferrienterochelin and colicin